jgi:hypothetical protein
MSVPHRRMPAHVNMRLARRVIRPVLMLVVLIMHVGMLVRHLLMRMLMFVALDKMQPQARAHQQCDGNQSESKGLPEQRQSKHCSDEGRRGKVGARPRRPRWGSASTNITKLTP